MHVPVASADMSTVVINPSSVILGKVLSRPSRAGGAFVENIDGSVSSGPLSIGGAGAVALGRAHDPPGDISVTSVMAEKAAGACLNGCRMDLRHRTRCRIRAVSRQPDVRTSRAHHYYAPWRKRVRPASLANIYAADARVYMMICTADRTVFIPLEATSQHAYRIFHGYSRRRPGGRTGGRRIIHVPHVTTGGRGAR
ncbi:hypothetical protein C3920_01480 [Novacetimonas pomaceti]|uniref:Uncharacterized protein n=2 Tax=Novacetimonas pomaceti TaxID=2021998 RepID=A0ABX5PAL0_9PROT|nr:hypothetical protein C3920_01480 [Novacetimonas pomaceti]